MSWIISKVESIEALRFEPFPTKPVNLAKMVRIGERVVVAVDERGRVFSTQVLKGVSYSLGSSSSLDSTLEGCIRLGVLSAAAVRAHRAHNEKIGKERLDQSYAHQLGASLRALGLKPSKLQHAAAVKALGGGKSAASLARIAEAGLELPA